MYRKEARLRCKDSSYKYKWVELKGRIAQSALNGQPLRVTGVSMDISVRKAWARPWCSSCPKWCATPSSSPSTARWR